MEESGLPPKSAPQWKSGWGVRHTQALLLFLGLAGVYALRMNLSLAVVAMPNSTKHRIVMDSGEEALVLSSFFWTYSLLQTYLSNLGRKGNYVQVFSWCLVTSAGLSMATPFVAIQFGFVGMIVLRALMGLIQGGIFGNLCNALSVWVVPQEKDVVCMLVYNGSAFGTLVILISAGYLAENFDWPSIFHITGIAGVIIGIAYLYYGRLSPDFHEGITKREIEFMRASLGDKHSEAIKSSCGEKQYEANKSTIKEFVPWKKILTSPPMLALTVTHWCASWGYWTMSTLTPTYLNGVLGFSIESDGLLSALSSGAGLCLGIVFMAIAIFIKKRNLLPISVTRFMWNSLSMYGMAAGLTVLSYVHNAELAVVLITLSCGITAAGNIGYACNHMDLSPNFTGVLYAFTNSIANTASILGPLISTYLVTDTKNLSEWRLVFLISAIILFIGNTVFLIFGTTKKQKWND